MKKLHFSTKIRNELAGRESVRRQPMTEQEKEDLQVGLVLGLMLIIMAAACCKYIGLF